VALGFSREAALAEKEDSKREAWRQWIAQRVEAVHRNVTIYDILSRNGVKLRGIDREEQFSCPFHGKDTKPSARAYPANARGHSHVWCFVCNERWDVIKLWKKFQSYPDDVKFGKLLREIEGAFGIIAPETPEDADEYVPEEDPAYIEVQRLFRACEHRLRTKRRAFDMTSFLRIGVVLDRLRLQVEEQKIPLTKARDVLTQVQDKIGARIRACPED
jgi:hypothetical protein